MTARDDLAELIWGATSDGPNHRDSDIIAEAIVAAGCMGTGACFACAP
jgi:hypothetical protein